MSHTAFLEVVKASYQRMFENVENFSGRSGAVARIMPERLRRLIGAFAPMGGRGRTARSKASRHNSMTLARLALEGLESRVLMTTFYVATTGSDSAAGGSTTPWKTLQQAANSARAGDTIIVRAGTYNTGANMFGLTGGTPTNPILFEADPAANAGSVIVTHGSNTGVNATVAAFNLENTGTWIIQGFTVNSDGSMSKAGIRIANSNSCQILNNVVNGAFTGIFVSTAVNSLIQGNTCENSTDQHGIYISLDTNGTIVRGNDLFGNAWDGLHMNCIVGSPNQNALVEDNIIHDNNLSGMDLEGVNGATFRNNIIYNNAKHGITIHSQDQSNTPATQGNTFVNNTIVNNSMFGIQMQSADTAETIFNNIIVTNGGSYGAIGVSGSPAGLVSDYNVVVDSFSNNLGVSKMTFAAWKSATGLDAHSIVGTATNLFVNAAGNDFHLKTGSLAIDAGNGSVNSKTAGLSDMDGNNRPQGGNYDAGAYEFNSTPDIIPPVLSSITAANVLSVQATITWNTNEASTTLVEYGTTTGYGSSTTLNTTLGATHSAVISALLPSTVYHYRVKLTDAAGNQSVSGDFTFTTAAPDVTPPTLSSIVTSSVSPISATVTWTTNEASDSQIQFGTSTSYGGSTTLDATMVTGHLVTIAGLNASTVYHYRVLSKDLSGNLTTSADFTFTTTTPPNLPSGNVAYYTFSESTGTTTADASGFGNNGTLLNGAAFGTGQTGNGATFDGVDDQIRISRNTNLEPAKVTLSAWVKIPTGVQEAQWASVIKKTYGDDAAQPWGSYALAFSPPGKTNFISFFTGTPGADGDNLVSTSAIPTGQWVHIAGTFDPSTGQKKLYVNGVQVASTTNTTAIPYDSTSTGDIYIGQDPGAGEAFKGSMDNVGIWNRALTAAEVATLAGSNTDTTPPVISAISTSGITNAGGTIAWTTNEASDTQVQYGATTSYGSTTTLNATLGTSHSAVLAGLAQGTVIHYRVLSRDAAGNLATSADQTFTTLDTVAPTATLTANTLTTGGGSTYSFTIALADNVAVSVASLDSTDILVTGPNGFSQNATFVSVNNNTNGANRTATYRITAPGGTWDLADNGVYTITMAASQISDTSGNYVAAGSMGTATVNIPDTTPPTAAFSTSNITASGTSTYSFSVTYSDNLALNVASLGSTDIQVTGPNGFSQLASFVGVNTNSNGAVRTATYSFTAPGGTWDLADNGTYTLAIRASEVADTTGNTATGSTTFSVAIAPTNSITSRNIFYKNSTAYDAGTDDGAIATDKSALLPGGTATFANYTSYDRGINGIMIDFSGTVTNFTAADFSFKVGNDNNPAGWTDAPAPISIIIRPGAGVNGSNRVEIVWADNAIQNEWLQVTVLSNAHTGLGGNDVFYYGNAIGEAGDSVFGADVNTGDQALVLGNPAAPIDQIPITNHYDFNRDGNVDATDLNISVNHATDPSSALSLIVVPATGITPNASLATIDIVAPAVNSITTANVTKSTADISWTTDHESDARVEFGPLTTLGLSTSEDTTQTTTHHVSLTGLQAGKTYYFSVRSRDAAGNLTVTNKFAFTTPSDSTNPGSTTLSSTTTTLRPSATKLPFGQALTLTAVVSAGTSTSPRTGTVTFKDGTTVLGVVDVDTSSTAVFTISQPTGGTHSYTATYSGDSMFKTGTSYAKSVAVTKVATHVTLTTPNVGRIATGQLFDLNALVTTAVESNGEPTGIVTFKDGRKILGTASLDGNGQATLSIALTTTGKHYLTAIYGGNTINLNSVSTSLVQLVVHGSTTTTLTVAPATPAAGAPSGTTNGPSADTQAFVYTATVARDDSVDLVCTGRVIFRDGNKVIATLRLVDGQASLTLTGALRSGITATYMGDLLSLASNSPVVEPTA